MKTATDTVKNNKTANYTVLAGDRNKIILCDATSAAFTVTLLAAATAGDGFTLTIKKTDATTNAVTIDGNASETIDGALTAGLATQYTSMTIISDGSNWNQQVRPAASVQAVVSRAYAETTAATALGVIPGDNTVPQSSEGTQILSAAITPSTITNRVRVTVTAYGGTSTVNNRLIIALFNGGSSAIATGCAAVNSSQDCTCASICFEHIPGSVSAQTYTVRAGFADTSGSLNSSGAIGALFGSSMRSTVILEELTA